MNHKQAIEGVRKMVALKCGQCWVLSQSGRLFGSAGIPDCFCVVVRPRNISFWVEVKVGRDKLSEAQENFKRFSESAGVPVIVGTSLEVEKFLEQIERELRQAIACNAEATLWTQNAPRERRREDEHGNT